MTQANEKWLKESAEIEKESAPSASHCSFGTRPRQMRLVREDDGSWRSWDNSIDDCMDGRESIEVREVTDCDRKESYE